MFLLAQHLESESSAVVFVDVFFLCWSFVFLSLCKYLQIINHLLGCCLDHDFPYSFCYLLPLLILFIIFFPMVWLFWYVFFQASGLGFTLGAACASSFLFSPCALTSSLRCTHTHTHTHTYTHTQCSVGGGERSESGRDTNSIDNVYDTSFIRKMMMGHYVWWWNTNSIDNICIWYIIHSQDDDVTLCMMMWH